MLPFPQHFIHFAFYFRKTYHDGSLVDRSSPEYDSDLKRPFINHISRTDAASASINLYPTVVKNGGEVTVSWNGVTAPNEKDFIAFYCPFYDNPTHYLDYFYVTESGTWNKGYGNYSVVAFNMRNQCVFKYFRAGSSYSQLVAESEKLSFADGGPVAPLQGHIAMTKRPSEMRVMWVSGEGISYWVQNSKEKSRDGDIFEHCFLKLETTVHSNMSPPQ